MIKLRANNYSQWKAMIEDHIICKDLGNIILNNDVPENKNPNE